MWPNPFLCCFCQLILFLPLYMSVISFCLFPAAWGALRECFPTCQVFGCGFHWVQCLRRRYMKLGLGSSQDPNLKKVFNRIRSIRFVPHQRIEGTFMKLKSKAQENFAIGHKVHVFLKYVEENWISSAAHPPSTWCQQDLVIRTNNGVEGWHRAFKCRMGIRPSVYSFLSKLAFDATTIIECIQRGEFSVKENRPKTEMEKKINAITTNLLEKKIRMGKFLDDVAEALGYNEKRGKKNTKK